MKERPGSSSGRSEESLKALTQRFDLEIVFKLSLAGKSLPSIACLEACINLLDLDLGNNSITKIEGLDNLVQLRRLNLSSNRITKIEGLGQLKKLETLKLQNNQITLEGLNLGLLAELPVLRTLYLQNVDRSMANPACKKQGYREAVLGKLASLSNLDGVRSPASIDWFQVAREADELAARPPLPAEVELPEVTPWIQGAEATALPSTISADPEFQAKSDQLVKGIDDCHTLAEVLKEELGKFQKQLLNGAGGNG